MNIASLISGAALSIISVAFLLAFLRLLRGPSLPDRVVALDLMATIGIIVLWLALSVLGPIYDTIATIDF